MIKKILIRTAVVIAGLLVVVLIAAFFWLRSSVSDYHGEQPVPGLSADVTIMRDENAFVHIFAQTLNDAYAGLGFAHAQDRLWQLELMKRVSQGRLAEIIGEDGLEYDYLAHTLNLAEMGRITGERMNQETKAATASYVSGINAYIDSHSGAWPLEFILLGVEPSRWTVADSLIMAGIGMFGMPNWEDELVNARLSSLIGQDRLQDFLPEYPADAPVTHDPRNSAVETDIAQKVPAMASWPFRAGGFSSNTWAIHGSHTSTGKPILASDPHGGLAAPTDYYLARLLGPDFEVLGASFPGLPGFLLGANANIAWGLTDMMADVTDLFVEKLASDSTYYIPDGIAPIITREAIIRVKGQEDNVIEVRETRHGPIVSDFHEEAAGVANELARGDAIGAGDTYAIAYASDGLKHGNLMTQAMVGLAKARSWNDFEVALSSYEFQHNFSFAAVDGSIGMISAARVPQRKPASDGLQPAPGWDGGHDWMGILGVEAMPRTLNPEKGFIFNGNNKLEAEDYPYVLSHGYSPPYRAMRAEELLSGRDQHDMDSVQAMQLDVTSAAAQQILPLLLTVNAPTQRAEGVVTMLRGWDGRMSGESAEPLIYTAWIKALSQAIYADEFGEMFDEVLDTHILFLVNVLRENSAWCDDTTTPDREDCPMQLSASLGAALAELEQHNGDDMSVWRWSNAHQAHFSNMIFSGIPLLSKLSEVFVGVGGNTRTLNNSRADFDQPGRFPATFGTRYRQIIDLSDLSNSRFIIAPGISGNIFSPYYKHLAGKWANGEYVRLTGSLEELKSAANGEFILYPE
jgi:penicillin amidase